MCASSAVCLGRWPERNHWCYIGLVRDEQRPSGQHKIIENELQKLHPTSCSEGYPCGAQDRFTFGALEPRLWDAKLSIAVE